MVWCGEVMVLYGNPQMGRVTQLVVAGDPLSSDSTSHSQSEKPTQIRIFGKNISDKDISKKWKVKFAQSPHLTQSETLLPILISLAFFLSFRYLCHHGVPPTPPPLTSPLNEYFQSQLETTLA